MQSWQTNDDTNVVDNFYTSSRTVDKAEALVGAAEQPPSMFSLQRGTSLGSLQSGSLGSGSSRGSSELYVYGAAQPMSDAERHTLYLEMVANFDEMSPLLRPPEVLAARPSTLDEFFDLESRIQRGELGEQALAHFEDFQAAIYAPREGSGGALSHESLVGLSDATNASLTVWAAHTPGGPQQQQQGAEGGGSRHKDPTSLGSDNSLSPSPNGPNANRTFFHTPAGDLGTSPSSSSSQHPPRTTFSSATSSASLNLSGTMRAEMELAEAQAWAAEAAAKAAAAHARVAEASDLTQHNHQSPNKRLSSSSPSSPGFNKSSQPNDDRDVAAKAAQSSEAATAAAQTAVAEALAVARVKEANALAAAGRAEAASETVTRVQERAQARQRQREQCSAYKVDLAAAAFGQCVCGQPKSAHSEAALKHKKQTLTSASSTNDPTSPEDRASVENAISTADALAQEASNAQAESEVAAAVLAKAQLALRSAMEKRSSLPAQDSISTNENQGNGATAGETTEGDEAEKGEEEEEATAAAQRARELQVLAEEAEKEAIAAAEAARVLAEAMHSSPVLPMNVVQRIIHSKSPQVPSSSTPGANSAPSSSSSSSAKTLTSSGGGGGSSMSSPSASSSSASNKHGSMIASDLAAEAYPTPPPRIAIPASSQRSFSPSAAGVVHFPSPLRKKLLSNVANVFARSEHAASALALAHSQRHSSSLADSEKSAQGTNTSTVVSAAASEIAQWWRSVTEARAEATCKAKEDVALSREVQLKQSDRWSMADEKAHSAADSIRALIEGKGYESPRKTALKSRVEALAEQEESNEQLKKEKASKTNAIRHWLSAQQQHELESESRHGHQESESLQGNEGMASLLAAAATYPTNARALEMSTSNEKAAPASPSTGVDKPSHATSSITKTPSASIANGTPKSASRRTQLYEVATALYEASLAADAQPKPNEEGDDKNQAVKERASTIVAPPNTPRASRTDDDDGKSIVSKMREEEDEEGHVHRVAKGSSEPLESPTQPPVPPLIMSPNHHHQEGGRGGGREKRVPLPSPTTLYAGGHELRSSSSGSFQREVSSPLSPAAVAAAAAAAAVLDKLPPPPVAAAVAAHANPHVQTTGGGGATKISIYDFINGCEITAKAATSSSSSSSSSTSPLNQGGDGLSPFQAKNVEEEAENGSPGSNSSRNLYARLAEAEEQAQNEVLEASSLPATPNPHSNSRSVFSTDDEEEVDDDDDSGGGSVYSSPLINQHSRTSAGATPARTPASANIKSGTVSIRAMMAMLANQAAPSPVFPSSEDSQSGAEGLSKSAEAPSSRTRGVRWQDQAEEDKGGSSRETENEGPKAKASNDLANATDGAFYVLDSTTNYDDHNNDSVISTSDFVQLLQANALGIEEFSERQKAAEDDDDSPKEGITNSTLPHTPAAKKTSSSSSSLARPSTPRERASEAMRANLEAAGFFPSDNNEEGGNEVKDNGGSDDDERSAQGHAQAGFVRLTLWSSQDLSTLVAALGPARDYAVLAKKIRKSGLDGLTLRDAYGIAALEVLLYELGWQQPESVHPLLRRKLHGTLEKLLADGGGVPPKRTPTTATTASSSEKTSASNGNEDGDGGEFQSPNDGNGQVAPTEIQAQKEKKRHRRRESWREIQAAQAAAEAESAAMKSVQRSEREALRAIGRQPKPATARHISRADSKLKKTQKEKIQPTMVLSPNLSGMLQNFM